ncbi:hypothetical protein TNCV_4868311 [Trichonephila clavipes]|nr:hypothetical protein TNCV_4868311 [Trichonephila clavipes]
MPPDLDCVRPRLAQGARCTPAVSRSLEHHAVVKPVSLKTKMILNKSKEAKVPKLLLDFVLQDAASQLSREQVTLSYHLRPSRLS